jgi:hypothetical protein
MARRRPLHILCSPLPAVGEGFDTVSLTANSANSLQQTPNEGEAESEAVWANCGPMKADLAAVVDAWSMLPEAIKAGILAMVRAACNGG